MNINLKVCNSYNCSCLILNLNAMIKVKCALIYAKNETKVRRTFPTASFTLPLTLLPFEALILLLKSNYPLI